MEDQQVAFTVEEALRIIGIARRAGQHFPEEDFEDICNSITIMHLHCYELDLEAFLNSNEKDFRYDLSGIIYYLGEVDGGFKSSFQPLCAVGELHDQ